MFLLVAHIRHRLIQASFTLLVDSITKLEKRQSLADAIQIVENLVAQLTLEPYASKLKSVLDKNPGYKILFKVSKVIRGSVQDFEGIGDPNLPALLANAPVTSLDCERVFSHFNDLLGVKRRKMTEEHLKDHMMVQWNKEMVEIC